MDITQLQGVFGESVCISCKKIAHSYGSMFGIMGLQCFPGIGCCWIDGWKHVRL
jgi:hypothetical protein